MPSPVELTLQTLLPTTNLLPTQLISVAGALLAQSKHAAPKLKQEEEIARTFTCCHIACERLANKLTLDIGKINPPCTARVYTKLHSYLDGALTAGRISQPATPRTPRVVNHADVRTPQSIRTFDDTAITPLTTTTLKSGVSSKTPLSSKRKREETRDEIQIPDTISQLSQYLCRYMELPEAAPHMYAGLEAVHAHLEVKEVGEVNDISNKRARKASAKASLQKSSKLQLDADKVALLVLAMFHSAITKLRATEVTFDEATQTFVLAVMFLRDKDEALAGRLYTDKYEDIVLELDSIRDRVRQLPFWQTWIDNIPQLENTEKEVEQEDTLLPRLKSSKTPLRRKEKHGQEDEMPGAAGLLPGLGTMFQTALDWLSDERVDEYNTWKEGILHRIAMIEQQG